MQREFEAYAACYAKGNIEVGALLHQTFNDSTTSCASLTDEFNLSSPNNPDLLFL